MEKKEGLTFIFLFLAIFLITSINASVSEDGYSCLESKIDETTCGDLSLEEQIFSVLATGKCSDELQNNALNNGTCWSTGTNCDVKLTSQAAIALEKQGEEPEKPVEWLLKQNTTDLDVDWYLQINSEEATNCTLNNSLGTYDFRAEENDKLQKTGDTHSCFSIDGEYRIKVDSDCYNQDFKLSCDSDFESSFLFESGYSSSIFISDMTQSGSAEETINLKVNSLTFKGTDYEGSLWATMILSMDNKDVSSYISPLIAKAEASQNQQYIPNSFLYFLTGEEDYSSDLISKQNSEGYWEESGNPYYDTAVALFPFANEDFSTKPNATSWLEEEQEEDGCWNNGDIGDTGFILASAWPKYSSSGNDSDGDGNGDDTIKKCEEDGGGYCMSDSQCTEAEGDVLDDYECGGIGNICCSEEKQETTCEDVGGTVCGSGEECTGSIDNNVAEDNCCVNGKCQEPEPDEPEESECEENLGNCRESCGSGEEEADYSCLDSGEVCCVAEEGGEDYTWLWIVLGALIIITIAFIFRKKLSKFFKEKFGGKGKQPPQGKGRSGSRGPGGRPPQSAPQQPRRQFQQRPRKRQQPQQQQPSQQRPRRGSKDLDKTMSKLKEMSQ